MHCAGRYNFTVLAGNEARSYGEFGTRSAVSSQLIVGAPAKCLLGIAARCLLCCVWVVIAACHAAMCISRPAAAAPVRAGPPGRPTADAPDTTADQLRITLGPGDPELVSGS